MSAARLSKWNDWPKLFASSLQEPVMLKFTANEAKARFGEILERAQEEPVRVMEHDRLVGVVVSARDFEAMRTFYADRLKRNLQESALEAERAGMTPELLDQLLADES